MDWVTPEVYILFNEFMIKHTKGRNIVGCLWLMPVILATQEAEIRRIAVQSQPREIV
jgi:hypothetical protein